MNSPSSNSGGSASLTLPPPPHEFYLVLPDGSCIPATPKVCRIVMKQARGEARKQAKIKRHEKAVELQLALEDRAAARRLLQELAEIERDRIRYAAQLRVRVRPDKPDTRTAPVEKRLTLSPMPSCRSSSNNVPAASSWVIDDRGMRGVIWQQSYLGRKSPNFYRGAARDNWEYDVRDEAVLLDANGEPIILSNMGVDWVEIGAGWQAIEDASVRKNAKIQIRAIAPFDADMSQDEMTFALSHFCETVLAPLGLPYSAVIHKPSDKGDQRNFHPHLAFSLRPLRRIAPYVWEIADEVRGELDGKDGVQMLRHLWAHSMSEAAERARSNRRYTGLGYGARGLDLEGGEHLGEDRSAMVRRGEQVWAHERNRIKNARNAARRVIRDADQKIAALTALRDGLVARAEADRAGAMPARRLVRVDIDRRTRRSTSRTSSRTAVHGPTPRVPANRGEHSHKPRVASRSPDPSLSIESVAAVRARSTTLTASRPAGSIAQLVRSVEPAERTPLVTVHAELSGPRLTASKAPPREKPPLEAAAPAARRPVMKATTAPGRLSVERLASTGEDRAPDPVTQKSRDMLAAFARWRDAQTQEMAIEPSDKSHKAKAQSEPVGGDAPDQCEAATPIVPPATATTYRRRRAIARFTVRSTDRAETLATREWLEDNPRVSFDEAAALQLQQDAHLIAALRKMDAYVADFGSGWLELDPRVAVRLGIEDERLQRAHIQRELTAIRQEQRAVVADLAKEASERPLAFAEAANRFWPNDLDPTLLRRLDHWHARGSEGLSRDLFPIERAVREAHRRDQAARGAVVADRPPVANADAGLTAANQRGEPGYRPAARVEALGYLRIPPFTPRGTPSTSLVLLLRHAAEEPDDIVVGVGEPPLVSIRTPEMVENLLNQWRANDRVMRAVAETIARSKAAGRPDWPAEFARVIRPPDMKRVRPRPQRRDADRSR